MTLLETREPVRVAGLDPNVAQRRASDPRASVWVGASAGTGKTKVLTDRVLRLMLAGTPPSRILCLTFTKAAAAEMANRIGRTLALWATLPDRDLEDRLADLTGERPDAATRLAARRLFAQVVDCPGGMKIQTIHAFCQSLLRRFPLEARLAPHFEVMDDRTAAELLAQAQEQVLRRARAEPDSPLGQAVARLTAEVPQEEFLKLMAELAKERGQMRRILDHHGGLAGTIAAVHAELNIQPEEDAAAILAAACRDDAFDGAALRRACRALAGGTKTDQERGAGLQAWLDGVETRAATFDAYARLFLTAEGEPRKMLVTKKVATAVPGCDDDLSAEAERLVAVRERLKAAGVAAATAALLVLAEALLETYEALKGAGARLDYDDLILAACRLLTDEARHGAAQWVLYKLDGGIDHILIDEAQDTNPDQWRVVAALAEEFFAGEGGREDVHRTLFVVGDEKQSIYSFQRADPAEFARMRQYFEARVTAAARTWNRVALDISFRSTDAVLRAVDAVFASAAARDGVALEASTEIRHIAHRRGHAGRVELWPPVSPQERPDPPAWAPPLTREPGDSPSARLAAVIADTIRAWLDRGELLPARGRPVVPGDVLVLVRRRSAFVEQLVRALKDRRIPVAGVDRMVLTEQLAVMDLMALGDFLLLPDDDLALATVLKGPLIGLSEEALFALAHDRPGTLWSALVARAETDPGLRPIRDYLGDLLGPTDFIAPFELYARVLSAPCPADPVSGRRALLARLGPEAQDPIDEFLNACLAFERSHTPSLQAFLHWLAAAEAEIKRELEVGGGQVRIMTVHGSKGLQAPIVFLPDTMMTPTQNQGPRILWPEANLAQARRTVPLFAPRRALEDRRCAEARAEAERRRDQEYRRLLYVALTRAEDRLYLCGWHGRKAPTDACWYRLAEAALATIAEPHHFDFRSLCPQGWSGTGWRLDDVQTVPAKDDAARRLLAGGEALPPWALAPAPPEPEPTRPLTPSRPDGVEPALRSPIGPDDGLRFKRGTLIHRLLQTLPDLAPAHREAACRRFLANPAHGLSARDQDAIATETLAVLDHPEFAPLFGPGSRAEVPLVGRVGDQVLSGQIDRLQVTADAVWIIDYKTNRPPPTDPAEVPVLYLRQMAAYRAVLQAIYPDRPVHACLLWTDGPRLMRLPAELLDRHAPGRPLP